MKNLVFLADFYTDTIRGGAEIVNDILISGLEKHGYNVTRLKTYETSLEELDSYRGSTFIVGNFVLLDKNLLKHLEDNFNYIIFEHDHKYLRTRDPSPFKDYKAPSNQIVHRGFYQKAIKVLCQSNVHAKVVAQNLDIEVVNLGCSMWSDEEIAVLRKNHGKAKKPVCAIVQSKNKVKGTDQAISFCREKDISYEMIGSLDYDEFIGQLASYESLAFFSQVLESFCRLILEARMLDCKVYTNGNNGCTTEPWFKEMKGLELIDFVENIRDQIIDAIAGLLDQIATATPEPLPVRASDITVILNSYRRPYNLKMQVDALRSQSIQPKEIWLWVNAHEDNKEWDYSDLGVDRVFHNDHNWKFYGRFAAALLADTDYVAIFDDDTIPGDKWFENCIDTMASSPGILGSAGVVLDGNRYVQHTRCGWPSQNPDITRVDLVGHAWFFKRDWLQYLWREKPTTWDNGEDIQFSYLAQKYGGIQTYCPPHPPDDKSMHGSTMGNELGIDNKATSTNSSVSHQKFFSERDVCVQTAIRGGWKTVNGITL